MSALVTIVEGAVPEALFRRLVSRVRALGEERMRQTYQTTFWFDLQRPAAVPEEVILALRAEVPARAALGVEWWLSRMWTHDVRVDFHQDRDEALAKRSGRRRHPAISSVLFLNRVRGGALAVTRQRPVAGNPAQVPVPLEADLVAPRPNRLVWFDGRLTHGVLDGRNQVPDRPLRGRGELRLSLVMNWWGKRPSAVPVLPATPHYRSLRSVR